MLQGENLGGWAVAGFFVLSGFLITRSRLRTSPGEYLLHRVARIYPGVRRRASSSRRSSSRPIARPARAGRRWADSSRRPSRRSSTSGATSRCTSTTTASAWTLQTVPYPGAWNGSLWTLFYEFLCYIVIWMLGFLAIFRKTLWFPVALWVAVASASTPRSQLWARLGLDLDFTLLFKLLPFFLGGVVAYFVFDRWGLHTRDRHRVPRASLIPIILIPGFGGQLAAPLLAYGLLWLSTVVRQPRIIAKHDVSYGFYIYAWPTAQILMLLGVAGLGIWAFIGVNIAVTFVFAIASWLLIERPVMRATKRSRPAAAPPHATCRAALRAEEPEHGSHLRRPALPHGHEGRHGDLRAQLYRELGRLAPEHDYIGYFSREGWALDRSWFPGEAIESGNQRRESIRLGLGRADLRPSGRTCPGGPPALPHDTRARGGRACPP